MSTLAIVVIVAGAVILLALIATRSFAKPKIDEQRRGKARQLRARADERRVRAEHAHPGATEQQARARREAIEADESAQAADEELALAGEDHRRARRRLLTAAPRRCADVSRMLTARAIGIAYQRPPKTRTATMPETTVNVSLKA